MPPSSNAAFLQKLLRYSYSIQAAHENLPPPGRGAKGPWTEEDEKLAWEDPITSLKKQGCPVDDVMLLTLEQIQEDAYARSAAVISNWKALHEIVHPKTFVEDDTAVITFGHAVGGLEKVYLHRCKMLFHDQGSHPYVSLLEDVSNWSEDEDYG